MSSVHVFSANFPYSVRMSAFSLKDLKDPFSKGNRRGGTETQSESIRSRQ